MKSFKLATTILSLGLISISVSLAHAVQQQSQSSGTSRESVSRTPRLLHNQGVQDLFDALMGEGVDSEADRHGFFYLKQSNYSGFVEYTELRYQSLFGGMSQSFDVFVLQSRSRVESELGEVLELLDGATRAQVLDGLEQLRADGRDPQFEETLIATSGPAGISLFTSFGMGLSFDDGGSIRVQVPCIVDVGDNAETYYNLMTTSELNGGRGRRPASSGVHGDDNSSNLVDDCAAQRAAYWDCIDAAIDRFQSSMQQAQSRLDSARTAEANARQACVSAIRTFMASSVALFASPFAIWGCARSRNYQGCAAALAASFGSYVAFENTQAGVLAAKRNLNAAQAALAAAQAQYAVDRQNAYDQLAADSLACLPLLGNCDAGRNPWELTPILTPDPSSSTAHH